MQFIAILISFRSGSSDQLNRLHIKIRYINIKKERTDFKLFVCDITKLLGMQKNNSLEINMKVQENF